MEFIQFINNLLEGGFSTHTIFMGYILINLFYRLKSDNDKKIQKILDNTEKIDSTLCSTARVCKPAVVLENLDKILEKLDRNLNAIPLSQKDVTNIEHVLKESNDKLIEIKSILLNRFGQ